MEEMLTYERDNADAGGDFEMLDEYAVFERTAPFHGSSFFDPTGTMSTSSKHDIIRDPTNRFFVYVKGISSSMIEQGVVSFGFDEINTILAFAQRLDYAKYKNPVAFVIGYDVTLDGGTIDVAKMAKLLAYASDHHPNANLRTQDIIRYCRLWKKLKGLA